MTTMQYAGLIEVVTINIEPGEMLLETIREALKKHSIKNGVAAPGIGTLKSYHLHHVKHCDFPSSNRFFAIERPLELSSISGIMANGEPYLHVVVPYADEETYSSHLEDSSQVLYLAEVTILVFNDLQMTRHFDKQRAISLLGSKR